LSLVPGRLLIVDDDARFSGTLSAELAERGHRVESVESLEQLRALDLTGLDYAVVDLRLRRDNGLDAVAWIRKRAPGARVVVLTGYASIATAVRAVQMGASNYLTKPIWPEDLERALAGELPDDALDPERWESPSLARHEREYIEYVLEQSDGNVSQAARRLGLHRQSLQRKLRKFTPR
jgi:two-component system, response regulator RegA